MNERSPLQLLLVEDDEVDRQMVRRLVARSGLRSVIQETNTAQECLGLVRDRKIDCLILDYRLPDGDGVDLTKKLVEEHGLQTPPIVMLTGAGSERLAVAALRTGVYDYLVKEAATPEDLENAILGAIRATADARREHEESLTLERQSLTDQLTDIGNRRRFDEEFSAALDLATKTETSVAVLVIDLDGFKSVNDRLGHGAGDEVLREVGRRLRKTVRDGDIPVRLGGDEFGVIMTSDVNQTSASRLANRVAAEIAKPYDLIDTAVSIGASIGVALAPEDGLDCACLLRVADRRMYDNKLATKRVPVPSGEAERLLDLHSYDILDTPAEEAFDQITRLASTVFGAPIALVSLVDARRQWFKSKVGIDANETGRDIAFCAHAISGDEIMVVEDTLLDERFNTNPLVTDDPSLRFYAGAPLKSAAGHNLGTLCVADRVPRALSEQQKRTLADLADLVVRELEFRKTNADGKH
ncbi:MAG: diguanylate cyclase [Proteobacteria bacterium]|nr:diguanylate cyclase [Pseudomonadota bacterium]MDA1057668.1 diguanylate cyclase [Pseudomonadota bacterium]